MTERTNSRRDETRPDAGKVGGARSVAGGGGDSAPVHPAVARPSVGHQGGVARFFARLLGGLVSLAALVAGLWSASKALEALLMAVVWIKQWRDVGREDRLRDLFAGAGELFGGADPMVARVAANPSQFALHAAGALALAVLGFFATWLILRVRRWALGLVVETSFSRFVSARYLLSRENKTLVSLITLISVLGIAVGVTALVVVISVIDGFDRVLVERTMGVFSHLQVRPFYEPMTESETLLERLESIPGVVAASPIITQQTFFQGATGVEAEKQGGFLRGLDPEREPAVTTLMDDILEGTGIPGDREVVIGSELGRRLRIGPGDDIYAFGRLARTARGPVPKLMRLRVVGVFKSGLYDVDSSLAYATLETVQRLFVMGDEVSAVHARLENPYQAMEAKGRVWQALDRRYDVQTWQEINPQFFEALFMEKVAMFVILLLIVLVAAFNIIGTLIMVVSQKTREIGILKSMGAGKGEILRIFLYHGLVIGIVGTGLGLALGLRLCWFVEHHIDKVYHLPDNIYWGIDKLPVDVEPTTIAIIIVSALLVSVTAALIPAVQASRLNPVEALRYQ